MTQIFYREPGAIVGLFASGKIEEALKDVRINPWQLIKGKYSKGNRFKHRLLDVKFYIILN